MVCLSQNSDTPVQRITLSSVQCSAIVWKVHPACFTETPHDQVWRRAPWRLASPSPRHWWRRSIHVLLVWWRRSSLTRLNLNSTVTVQTSKLLFALCVVTCLDSTYYRVYPQGLIVLYNTNDDPDLIRNSYP